MKEYSRLGVQQYRMIYDDILYQQFAHFLQNPFVDFLHKFSCIWGPLSNSDFWPNLGRRGHWGSSAPACKSEEKNKRPQDLIVAVAATALRRKPLWRILSRPTSVRTIRIRILCLFYFVYMFKYTVTVEYKNLKFMQHRKCSVKI